MSLGDKGDGPGELSSMSQATQAWLTETAENPWISMMGPMRASDLPKWLTAELMKHNIRKREKISYNQRQS